LIVNWTHGSTGLEGNTLSEGDTQLILSQGLTVSGKSLLEHQEVHGHAQAIQLLEFWAKRSELLSIGRLHDLHRAIQTGIVIDIYNPVGRFKVEVNGTQATPSNGRSRWHEYAQPFDVPDLMKDWLHDLKEIMSFLNDHSSHAELVKAYAETHLGFTSIHPYADGNGRLARLLANIPLLEFGMPPLTINPEKRKLYMTLMGDYTIARGTVLPGDPLVIHSSEFAALHNFFMSEWKASLDLIDEFKSRQCSRNRNTRGAK
jgi:Fic family protein